ncbi:uncharacterized protein LOC127793536 isoform X2 [Diospyros lotus]|uniref:uncharacterized protein LOC127793536 isoform X2 n=1 Tax=Diospyros lotus TaxID=55363 RepID=UPI00224FA9A0|nr:uncharacterized protein LOC127793536 isoform X2 [Diospyros lotus]
MELGWLVQFRATASRPASHEYNKEKKSPEDNQKLKMAFVSSSSSSSSCSLWSRDMPVLKTPWLGRLNCKDHIPRRRRHLLHHHPRHRGRTVRRISVEMLPNGCFLKDASSATTSISLKCFSQRRRTPPPLEEEDEEEELELERLFSNLNKATLKREPGSLTSAIFLVSGTTVGAGILAIPAVTQESGFLASAITCIICWVFMVVTGLLVAEVNVNTMCELGSGGVSLVSMAKRTLGTAGVQIACWSYIFIHYALLVAYVARSSDILTNFLGIPLWESATLFSLLLGGICYIGSQRFIGAVNGVLIFGIIISFAALVAVASGNIHWDALLKANFEAVPLSIPIIALSFVYQNVVPVLCMDLEGNLPKVRTAIVLGTAIPLALFLIWNAVILGSITSLEMGSDKIADPLQLLRSTNAEVGPIIEVFSLLAIATSYIGFVLGLVDFLADCLGIGSCATS